MTTAWGKYMQPKWIAMNVFEEQWSKESLSPVWTSWISPRSCADSVTGCSSNGTECYRRRHGDRKDLECERCKYNLDRCQWRSTRAGNIPKPLEWKGTVCLGEAAAGDHPSHSHSPKIDLPIEDKQSNAPDGYATRSIAVHLTRGEAERARRTGRVAKQGRQTLPESLGAFEAISGTPKDIQDSRILAGLIG